jgi:hypothetical protein
MAHRRSVQSLFLGFCLMLLATSAFAQQGTIAGRITRANGSGIGGVIVQVVELSRVELSDSDGNFRFTGVPAGPYTVQFTAADKVATENITVASGATTRADKQVDWSLSVAETITVYSASRRTRRWPHRARRRASSSPRRASTSRRAVSMTRTSTRAGSTARSTVAS